MRATRAQRSEAHIIVRTTACPTEGERWSEADITGSEPCARPTDEGEHRASERRARRASARARREGDHRGWPTGAKPTVARDQREGAAASFVARADTVSNSPGNASADKRRGCLCQYLRYATRHHASTRQPASAPPTHAPIRFESSVTATAQLRCTRAPVTRTARRLSTTHHLTTN